MADRYPNEDYGRGDMSRGRGGRWRDEERQFGSRGRRQERGSYAQDFDQDFDRDGGGYAGGYGGYGGGHGAGYGGAYAGGYGPGDQGYGRGYESERSYGQRSGQGMGGMRGQSYGGGYRDRGEWDREYGLQGSGYDQRSQGYGRGRQGWGGPGGDISEQGWGQRGQGWSGGQDRETGLGAGGYYTGRQSFQGQGDYQGQGYRGQGGGYGQMQTGGFGNQTGWNEGGSFGQGRPGMGAQGYERSSQDYGGYEGSFGQGGFLSRGGRRQWGRHSGRGPKNYTRSDDRIREDINDRLTEDPEIDATEIDVKVSNCEVTLTGTVDSREEKRRAEDCAESVSGVKNVQNNLRVQPASEEETPRTSGGKKGQKSTGDEQRIQ